MTVRKRFCFKNFVNFLVLIGWILSLNITPGYRQQIAGIIAQNRNWKSRESGMTSKTREVRKVRGGQGQKVSKSSKDVKEFTDKKENEV